MVRDLSSEVRKGTVEEVVTAVLWTEGIRNFKDTVIVDVEGTLFKAVLRDGKGIVTFNIVVWITRKIPGNRGAPFDSVNVQANCFSTVPQTVVVTSPITDGAGTGNQALVFWDSRVPDGNYVLPISVVPLAIFGIGIINLSTSVIGKDLVPVLFSIEAVTWDPLQISVHTEVEKIEPNSGNSSDYKEGLNVEEI